MANSGEKVDINKPTTDPISKMEWGEMNQSVKDIRADLSEIKVVLLGNGNPDVGLVSRTSAMRFQLDTLQASMNRTKNLLYGLFISLVVPVLGFLGGVLVHKITVNIP